MTGHRQQILRRIALVMGIALLTGLWTAWVRLSHPTQASDLEIVRLGANAWLAGNNPYTTVAVGAPKAEIPLMYPFPAILLFAPFAAFPRVFVDVVWNALGSGCLAWALTSKQLFPPAMAMFIATPFVMAIQTSQWTPQLTAAALLPWGGWLFACKPTTALWLFAYRPTLRHVVAASIAIAISLAFWPTWPLSWQAVFGRLTVASPITLPGGALMLLALLRWRRPEARLLAVMAVTPHSILVYEALPLFLIPATWIEAGVLWVGTGAAVVLHDAFSPYPSAVEWLAASGRAIIWCVYLPALVMILKRPNAFPAEDAAVVARARTWFLNTRNVSVRSQEVR